MTINKTCFGELIQVLREKNNISQKKFADMLNVSSAAVSKWENGKNLPDVETICAIADLFHLFVDDLLHPEITLENIKNQYQSEYMTPKTVEKKDNNRKIFKILVGLISFLALIIILGLTIKIYNYKTKTSIYHVAFSTKEESDIGIVLEVSCVLIGNKSEEIINSFCDKAIENLNKNNQIDADIKAVKFYFYSNEKSARLWKETDAFCVIFL